MDNKQFIDAFTAAGGWFIAKYYEMIADFCGENKELVALIFHDGTDKNISGTSTRVSSVKRIIEAGCQVDALVKIRDSVSIARIHPESSEIASEILKKRFGIL